MRDLPVSPVRLACLVWLGTPETPGPSALRVRKGLQDLLVCPDWLGTPETLASLERLA